MMALQVLGNAFILSVGPEHEALQDKLQAAWDANRFVNLERTEFPSSFKRLPESGIMRFAIGDLAVRVVGDDLCWLYAKLYPVGE